MQLREELINSVQTDFTVTDAVVGSHLIAVAGRRVGLAAYLSGEAGASGIEVSTLSGKSARELASWLHQEKWLEAGIGMAALNSLIEVDQRKLREVNAKQIIAERAAGKKLMVVGHFPFVEAMRSSVRNLWVMEKQPRKGDFSEEEGYQLLSEADVVAITGSSLINHSFEKIMSRCKPQSFKIMLGPSTPLSPILFNYGLDVLGGALVEDAPAVVTMVGKGCAFRQLKSVRTVVMTKDPPGEI
jgi:uncharacterized protein (DUF4213/DUF364 family)